MKKLLLISLLAGAAGSSAYAQAPFFTADSIDVNNINARLLVHGDMWWQPDTSYAAKCHFPKNSPASINFASALWMSGYDASNNLHMTAQTYRQTGNDYWPGPLDASDTLTYSTSQKWAKIWKVNRSDISDFLGLSTHTTTNTPAAILTWPAKGNVNAAGNAGAPLTITTDMAPFVDLNSNGIYEPLLGEYPAIQGDQALWWVFSDNGPSHTETHGKHLGVEIHAMCYAYSRGTAMDNIVYYDYNIINKSANSYHNFRLGQWDDVDLGWYNDDYIGFDSSHRMGICYSGVVDDGAAGGHPLNSYGTHIPMVGLTMIVLPGDAGTTYVPAGSFTYYNNDASIIGNPTVDTEYNNYLRGKIRNGQHFTNDYSGPGVASTGHGAGPQTNYVFTGDPSNTTQWSECTSNNIPGDRRFIITSNDFSLNAGASQRVVMALIATPPSPLNKCPGATFDSIKMLADTAWAVYFNPPPPNLVNNIKPSELVRIYPNPSHDRFCIDHPYDQKNEAFITIYNSIGQILNVSVDKGQTKDIIDIGKLAPGAYYMLYRVGNFQRGVSFIKE